MHFGEMALIEKKALLRSTSILAASNCVLAVLTKKDFDMICFHYPDFSNQLKKIQEQRTKDSLAKGIMMSFKRNASIVNKALSRLLTQRKTIPILNDEPGL